MKATCDSDVFSNFARDRGRGAREVREALARGELSLNVIMLYETRGAMEHPSKIAEFDRLFAFLPVLDLTRAAALRAGDLRRDLRRRGDGVHDRDLLIAAIADAAGIRLLTADHDFEPLKKLGLDIEIVGEPEET